MSWSIAPLTRVFRTAFRTFVPPFECPGEAVDPRLYLAGHERLLPDSATEFTAASEGVGLGALPLTAAGPQTGEVNEGDPPSHRSTGGPRCPGDLDRRRRRGKQDPAGGRAEAGSGRRCSRWLGPTPLPASREGKRDSSRGF